MAFSPITEKQLAAIQKMQADPRRAGEPVTPPEVLAEFSVWRASRWMKALASGKPNPEMARRYYESGLGENSEEFDFDPDDFDPDDIDLDAAFEEALEKEK